MIFRSILNILLARVKLITVVGSISTIVSTDELMKELRTHVRTEIGPIATPEFIQFADGLPKTRSGKIMRRLLRTIAKGEEITQDTSTLENEAILDQLQGKA